MQTHCPLLFVNLNQRPLVATMDERSTFWKRCTEGRTVTLVVTMTLAVAVLVLTLLYIVNAKTKLAVFCKHIITYLEIHALDTANICL